MTFGEPLRRYWWPEILLFVAVALPWLSLLVLGVVWLWQGGQFGPGRSRPPSSAYWLGPYQGLSGGGPTRRLASRSAIWPSPHVAGMSLSETPGPRCSRSRTPQPHFPLPRWNRSSRAPVR